MINKSNVYFKELLIMLQANESLSYMEQNQLWLKNYHAHEKFMANNNLDLLPKIITLIYPDFLINSEGKNISESIITHSGPFGQNINIADRCQYSLIDPVSVCEFNEFRSIRGKCQADHFWPHSLGGPSVAGNRILLCRFHNLAKSNSIMYSFWNDYPTWLNTYLENLYNLKK